VLPGSVKDSTVDDYRYIIASYVTPHVGRHRLAKLTPEHVQAMMRALEEAGYSSRTRQYARAVLRRALRWAEQTGLVARQGARWPVMFSLERTSRPVDERRPAATCGRRFLARPRPARLGPRRLARLWPGRLAPGLRTVRAGERQSGQSVQLSRDHARRYGDGAPPTRVVLWSCWRGGHMSLRSLPTPDPRSGTTATTRPDPTGPCG